jgi:hypothetical protein
MDFRVDRVQAQLCVWRAGLGYRVVTVDYAPGYGDPLARALLDKAMELNLAAAIAGNDNPTMGGISG